MGYAQWWDFQNCQKLFMYNHLIWLKCSDFERKTVHAWNTEKKVSSFEGNPVSYRFWKRSLNDRFFFVFLSLFLSFSDHFKNNRFKNFKKTIGKRKKRSFFKKMKTLTSLPVCDRSARPRNYLTPKHLMNRLVTEWEKIKVGLIQLFWSLLLIFK